MCISYITILSTTHIHIRCTSAHTYTYYDNKFNTSEFIKRCPNEANPSNDATLHERRPSGKGTTKLAT